MKIKIIRPTVFRKQPVQPSNEPIEVTKDEAWELISAGKAVAVKDDVVENTDQPMTEVETTDAAESAPAEPEAKPRSRKKKASE